MKNSVLLFTRRRKASAREASDKLAQWIQKQGLKVIDLSDGEQRISEKAVRDVRLGVVVGGDGTFLTLVRRLEKKDLFPILGINCGTLGFITEVGRPEMISAMKEILAGKYVEELRRLLSVDVWRNGKRVESGLVFNDAVITKDARTTMVKLDVSVQGEHLSYVRADGYIVSTPTGSTAYCLSAGGPLLHPKAKATVLVPISPHSLSARAIVIPQEMDIEIKAHDFNGAVYLVYDGQIVFQIEKGDLIKFTLSEASLRLIKSPRQKWSEALRAKLRMA